MTREHKLALIVGFSLVLVVGILISDHLSPASLDEPLETLSFNLPLADPEPFVVPSPRPAQPVERTPEQQPTNQSLPSGTDSAETPPANALAGDPSSGSGAPRQDEVRPFEIVQGLGRPNTEQPGGRSNERSRIPGFVPVPDDRPMRVTPSTPSSVQHVVQKGETVAGLARRYLGSDERWREIQTLNPGLVAPDGGVNAGVTLKIPSSPSAAQPPSTPARTQPKSEPKPEQKPRNETKPAPQRTYVVKANDTLSQIAQRELGSKNRMAEILKLNQDKISNPDEIYEGLRLVLPAA